MNFEEESIDLAKLRSDAGLSQQQLGEYLDLSQSQVSRYEGNPDDIPAGLQRKWLSICGMMASSKGVSIEDPRDDLERRLRLMTEYATVAPPSSEDFLSQHPATTPENFLSSVRIAARKPRVGVFGNFDAGKSRLLNVLLGGNRLPTGYQPKTSAVCLLRHMADKPAWQPESVWLMGKGFDLNKADDQHHCLEHKILAGGYDSIAEHGTHKEYGRTSEINTAIVYIDAPLLLAADMIDLPGFENNEDDQSRAEMAQKTVDVMIYASPANGFLKNNDLSYLSVLLQTLPTFTDKIGNISPLCNMYVVATQAHIVGISEREGLLDLAASRGFSHLEHALAERAKSINSPISLEDFRSRFFTFSADASSIRSEIENDLVTLLTEIIPAHTLKEVNRHVELAKANAVNDCDNWIKQLQTALRESSRAQDEVRVIEKDEPNRQRRNAERKQKILSMIEEFSNESEQDVKDIFERKTSVSAIEEMIKKRYDNKKDAQELAASYLINTIQNSINSKIRTKSKMLGEVIDEYLDGYGPSISGDGMKPGIWDFNPRVAFMSALSGVGTIGALAAWASIAAAGSNLGAYILIAQVVGWLSSIGISVGSASTVMATVSALGGPVTIGLMAGFAVALAIFSLFGDSWQTKLAKKIVDGLKKQEAQSKFIKGIAKYWDDSLNAFEISDKKTEEDYQEHLTNLKKIAFSYKPEELEDALKNAASIRNFFAGMPWRPIE